MKKSALDIFSAEINLINAEIKYQSKPVAAPATAEYEGIGRGELDHTSFASFQCFVPD